MIRDWMEWGATVGEVPDPGPARDTKRAHQLLLLTLVLYLVAVAIASPWDIYWHTQKSFETFWAPPHLLIYSSTLLATATVGGIAANPRLRACFGRPLPGLPRALPVPGPLVILGSGFMIMIAAGGFDNIWHTNWGQNETRWSYPHGLIAWGVYTVSLGFVACRLALRRARPFGRGTAVGCGVLVFAFSISAFFGPMAFNTTPEVNAAVAAMPGFWGPDTQGLMAMVARFHLERTNLFFPAQAAAWAAAGLAVVPVLDGRPRSVLATTAVATVIYTAVMVAWAVHAGVAGSWTAWAPVPLLPGAIVFLLCAQAKLSPPVGWALTGLSVALVTAAIYNPTAEGFALTALGLPVGWAAGLAGEALAGQLKDPTPKGLAVSLGVLGLVAPALFGAIDLYLRFSP